MKSVHWELARDEEEVAVLACRQILLAAERAIVARGRFRIVLAGGRTPERTYCLLSESASAWHCWQIYFGDERCRPADDPQRNSLMASRAWLNRVAISPDNIHMIPAELGPQKAAQFYEPLVRQALPFDLVLLGLGSDGHTASLFPNRPDQEESLVQAVSHAPKAPLERVTLSAAALSQSQEILVLVSGMEKRKALGAWQRGERLPISTLQPMGDMTVIYDREADPGSLA